MKKVREYYFVKILIALFFIGAGFCLLYFSSYKYMNLVLGYIFASLLCLIGASLIVKVFFVNKEKFFNVILYLIMIALGVVVFLRPNIFVIAIPIVLGVLLLGIGLTFLIKFIIIKRAPMRSMFNVMQVIIFTLMMIIGVLFCVFYQKIDVIITSIIFGLPMIVFGVIFLIYDTYKFFKKDKRITH